MRVGWKSKISPVRAELAKSLKEFKAKGSILVVDDNDDTIEVTRRAIEKFTGFQVLTATNGKDALAIMDEQVVDVVVLDFMMPDMNGSECYESIRQKDVHTPVIFLTGYPNAAKKREQLALGAFDYLSKPVRARDLIFLINDAYRTVQKIRKIIQDKPKKGA